ncbi:DNA polymerase-like [Primulina huaijiensis]|uniref:DNA polymerase-like n=1 Tax=Primulina huaijiensis TaxID=1492673 RepID=UPI003CC6F85E
MVKAVFIRIYYESKEKLIPKSIELPNINIEDILNVIDSEIDSGKLPDVKSLISVKSRTPIKVTTIKGVRPECYPFIVADLETILVNNVHVPYAAGYLVVKSGDDLTSKPSIHTFFSEDHIPFYHTFEERSERILHDFFYNLEVSVLNIYSTRLRTIYFHNFSRFDGIIILRYFVDRHKYKIRTLFRNHKLYELKIYLGDKLIFRFRDSCTLLPSSLATLGKTLCPELGSKGSIPHEDLKVSNLQVSREELINYHRQDILLLGGVMLKAQEVNWSKYHIDIEEVMTLSSLSLKIFRMHYLDDKTFPIHIPTQNQDTFIRRAYYGGHVDVYKPYGENLYYYDVNSLYPYIMKSYPMPCGVPVWRNNLESVELDSLFGFIEAYVVCPTNISRPFLPYKDQYGTLIFPTGKFIGVFYSEELKFARDLGYEIIPLRGYLFEKKSSPFESFISHLYESRLDAKKRGDEAMTFIYKILMNSLYGRFGMNPESTVTEICDQKRYEELMKKDTFQSAEKLTDHYYIVNYITNFSGSDDDWKPPRMSAVQLSAAITACARIHMYPHISRPDCYYTDTDSIVLGSPLPEDQISSSELGKFKLEHQVNRGIFLAPKSYMLEIEDERHIIKHKGPAKDLVTSEWFVRQLADLSQTEKIPTDANFRIDWKRLQIVKKELILNLGLPRSTKRENIYESNNVWIDTRPKEVIDLGTKDATTIFKYELLRNNDESVSKATIDEGQETFQPTLYNTKPKKAKKAKSKRLPKDHDNSSSHKPDE